MDLQRSAKQSKSVRHAKHGRREHHRQPVKTAGMSATIVPDADEGGRCIRRVRSVSAFADADR